jgi:thiol-disulfide isomerase/thioredoxin
MYIFSYPYIFLKFYSQYCPRCKAVANTFIEASNRKSEVIYGEVDCLKNPKLAFMYEISTYPSFKLIVNRTKIYQYKGDITVSAINRWVNAKTNQYVPTLSSKSQLSGVEGSIIFVETSHNIIAEVQELLPFLNYWVSNATNLSSMVGEPATPNSILMINYPKCAYKVIDISIDFQMSLKEISYCTLPLLPSLDEISSNVLFMKAHPMIAIISPNISANLIKSIEVASKANTDIIFLYINNTLRSDIRLLRQLGYDSYPCFGFTKLDNNGNVLKYIAAFQETYTLVDIEVLISLFNADKLTRFYKSERDEPSTRALTKKLTGRTLNKTLNNRQRHILVIYEAIMNINPSIAEKHIFNLIDMSPFRNITIASYDTLRNENEGLIITSPLMLGLYHSNGTATLYTKGAFSPYAIYQFIHSSIPEFRIDSYLRDIEDTATEEI